MDQNVKTAGLRAAGIAKKNARLALKNRKFALEYYLKAAKTDLAKMYWYGRLDELAKVQKMERKKP